MATSLCLFYGNISMPPLWQYLYVSSMAIYLCLLYGNISMPLLWQYLYASSMAISLCLFYGNIVAAMSNIHLLLQNISFCFCEQSSMEISLLLQSMYFASASSIYLLMQAMPLYLFASASNISLLLRAILFNIFFLQVPKFLSICFFFIQDNKVLLIRLWLSLILLILLLILL